MCTVCILLSYFYLFLISFCYSLPSNKPNSTMIVSSSCVNYYHPQCNDATVQLAYSDLNKTCQVEKFNSSEACGSLKFEGRSDTFPSDVKLNTYLYVQELIYLQTAFNLTLNNVTWKSLQIRYQSHGEEMPYNYCRRFTVPSDIPMDFTFFFDCLFQNNNYEELTYHLEISADDKFYKKYTFLVPAHERFMPSEIEKNASKVEVFMYVDVSEPGQLTLNFQRLPAYLQIEHYNITLQGENFIEEKIINENGTIGLQNKTTVTFKTPISNSPYVFKITPFGGKCGGNCASSKSPSISFSNVVVSPFVTGLCVVVFIALIAGVIAIVVLKRKPIKFVKKPTDMKPIVLFIYKSTHKSHVDVIDKFCSYLESQGLEVLLDRRDIQKSSSKDPYIWFLEAFKKANFVLVFSSLQCCPSDVVGVYRKVDNIAISQLKVAVAESRYRFASVLLPYCNKEDIPAEASKFKLFSMPNEIIALVDFIKQMNGRNRLKTNFNSNNTDDISKLKNDLNKCMNDAHSILLHHEKEAPLDDTSSKLDQNDYDLDDMEKIKMLDSDLIKMENFHISENSEAHHGVYPNLNDLNLFGEQPINYTRNINNSDDPSTINFRHMKL